MVIFVGSQALSSANSLLKLPQVGELGSYSAAFSEDLFAKARITTYGLTQGLPGLSLNALEIDSDGLLWIGTTSGLFSYDGSDFRALADEDGKLEGGQRISALHRDRQGALWIAVADGQLVQFVDSRVVVPEGLAGVTAVQCILEASDGNLWFGGIKGLYRLSPEGVVERIRRPVVADAGAQARTTSGASSAPREVVEPLNAGFLVEDPADGSVLVGTSKALLRWTGGNGLEVVHDQRRTGVFFDESQRRWELSTSGAIYRDGEQQFFALMPAGQWLTVEPIGGGRHFIGASNGNYVFSLEDGSPELRKLDIEKPIRALVSDRPGCVWLATLSDGMLLVEDRDQFVMEPPVQGAGRPVREVIQVDSERVLVNRSEDDGVLLVTPSRAPGRGYRSEFFPAEPGVHARTHDACLSSTGEILVATAAGLGRLSGGRIETLQVGAAAMESLVSTGDGFLWGRQKRRLVEMSEDGRPTGRSIASRGRWNESCLLDGRELYLTEHGTLFVCSLDSLEKTEVFSSEGSWLRTLYLDAEGGLWVTTYGDGLYRLRRDGRLDHWSIADGLPDPFLGWIGAVPGDLGASKLWINSNSGAICVARESLDAVAEGSADLLDCRVVGSDEASGIGGAATRDGTVVLPTMGGVIAVSSAVADRRPAPPRAILRAVHVDQKSVRPSESIRAVGETDLEFFYDIVHLPSSHRVETQSRLIGHEEEWTSGRGERSKRYTNIDEGTYRFALRARGSSGAWSDEVRSREIVIRRHWYAQLWFRVLSVFGLGALAALAFLMRTRALLARSQLLEDEIERRETAERELLGQRRQFESVLEGAHDGIFAFDAKGTILYANPAMHWTFGAASADIVGAKLESLGIPGLNDEASLKELVSASEVRQRWKTLEASARRIDGESFDLEVSIASDVNSDDGCFVGIVRDISDRKQMLERLRRSEERYRRLYQTVPMAIIVWRPRLKMLEWNQRATDLFGWSIRAGAPAVQPNDVNLYGIIDGEVGIDAMRSSVRRVLNGGRDCVETVRTRVARGEVRNCRWHLAPLMKSNGKVWAFISTVVDMSQEDRVNRDFQALRGQLARAEETERARIARELHDDLSQRMAAVALDLQMSESRIADLGEPDLAVAFQELRVSVESVATDVHSLSRQLHPTVLDDLGLLSALRSECARRAKRSGVEITCEGNLKHGEPSGATGLALFRVVQEALQNALTHGHPTRVAVVIFQDGNQLDLTVEDNGGGFSLPRKKPSESSVRRGIGFASMRERMTLVGGDLRVNTMLGTGTVVRAVVSLAPLRAGEKLVFPPDSNEIIPRPPSSPSVPETTGDPSDSLH